MLLAKKKISIRTQYIRIYNYKLFWLIIADCLQCNFHSLNSFNIDNKIYVIIHMVCMQWYTYCFHQWEESITVQAWLGLVEGVWPGPDKHYTTAWPFTQR